jgi:surface antigen
MSDEHDSGKKAVIAAAAIVVPVMLFLLPMLAIGVLLGTQNNQSQGGGAVTNVPEAYRADVSRAGGVCTTITAPLIASQINAESGWNPTASSGAGAQGIAQFMPGTWKTAGRDGDGDGKADVWNAHDAIWSQGNYMCGLAGQVAGLLKSGKIKGDTVQLALAAYNAGIGAVISAGGLPGIPETVNYVGAIIAKMPYYTDTSSSGTGAGTVGTLTPKLVMRDATHVNVEATGTDQSSSSYAKFQCTWWAFIRRRQIGKPVSDHMGNGGEWDSTARSLGMSVSLDTRPGDAITFHPGVHGSSPVYGHVAIVEQVNDDGSILISQSGTGWMAVVTETISKPALSAMGNGIAFIH